TLFPERRSKVFRLSRNERSHWSGNGVHVEPESVFMIGRNMQHPRNEAVLVMRKEGLAHWKKMSGYHRRSLAETAMYRFKQLMTGKISLRNYNGQVGEVMAYVGAINKLMEWSPLPKTASNVPKWRMKLSTD
ncbi:hypothetical protein ACEUD2_11920, partial [Aeromonas veronii]